VSEIDRAKHISTDEFDRAVRDRFRFAISRKDGRHSHTWAVWGKKNDFYITSRSIGGQIKTSLHDKGGFRVHFDKNFLWQMKAVGREPPKREVVLWPKPLVPETGAVHVASVLFPTDYLTADAPKSTKQKPIFIFEAPAGRAVEVGFFYSLEGVAALEPKFSKIGVPCICTTLDNCHSVLTVVRVRDFAPNVLPKSDLPSSGVYMFDEDGLGPGGALTNCHAVLWNDPKKDGLLKMIEIGGVQIRRKSW